MPSVELSACIILIKAKRYTAQINSIAIKQRLWPVDRLAVYHCPGFGAKIFNHPTILIL